MRRLGGSYALGGTRLAAFGDLIDVRISASVRTASPTWRIGPTGSGALTIDQVFERVNSA
jgi:hypothetical protein